MTFFYITCYEDYYSHLKVINYTAMLFYVIVREQEETTHDFNTPVKTTLSIIINNNHYFISDWFY